MHIHTQLNPLAPLLSLHVWFSSAKPGVNWIYMFREHGVDELALAAGYLREKLSFPQSPDAKCKFKLMF